MPKSLLLRSFILISSLVMLTTASWLIIFRHADDEPRARELAQLTTSGVNLVRAALLALPPEKRLDFLHDLASREGIRLLPAEPEDRVVSLPPIRFFELLQKNLQISLGNTTQVAMEVNGIHGFWVSFELEPGDEDQFWMVLPKERVRHGMSIHLLSWGILALSMALIVAWVIVTHLTQPLRLLADAARRVGMLRDLPPLPTNGPMEVREVNIAFNRMSEDLRQHESERAEVLAGISHDLRTPLARLRLEAEMGCADEATRQGMAADIEQMDSIIAQFLDYARSDDGEAPTACDLMNLAHDIAHHAEAIGKPITLDIPSIMAPQVLALPVKALRRSIQNLLENAWRYAGEEGVRLGLSIREQKLVISVHDSGPGIPDEAIERLKRPFTRLETARSNATGTGLGLAIVERFARRLGGQLNLSNAPSGGLLAEICLPLPKPNKPVKGNRNTPQA